MLCTFVKWRVNINIHLPVTKSIQTALNIFLESEELRESDLCFCNFCASYQPASMDHQITKVGIYLILELKRFINHNADFIKDFTKVSSHENFLYHLLMRFSFHKKFSLKATANHTGTLNRGQYTAFIKQLNTSSWLFCNDAAIVRSSVEKTNNTSIYIYVYEAI